MQGDALIFLVKLSPSATYLYGVTCEKLVGFTPPKGRQETIDELAMN